MNQEKDITFEIVRPCEADARRILEWRNDPDTLQMFFHRRPKTWESFYKEFTEEYFRYPDLPPVFAQPNCERIGFLRFKPFLHTQGKLRNHCDISINIVPGKRGEGLGTAVLKGIIPFLRDRGMDDLFAEVRIENARSRKAFEKAGFESLGEAVRVLEDTGESIPIVRYRSRLTDSFLSEEHVFVIAEAGSNWRMGTPARDLAMARSLIDVAAVAGADAVKFQTYRPETVYVPNAGQSDYLADAGLRQDIRAIFADLAMPYEMIPELASYCAQKKVLFMSTPFSPADFAAIDPHAAVHKVASYEISHLRLLECIGRAAKPVVVSTGASREADIDWAVRTLRENGASQICLMQCTAKYPAPPESMNLRVIPWMRKRFGVTVGLSDHSRHPVRAPVCAVSLGARVIEKHFTLDNRLPGPDHAFAVLPGELAQMIQAIRETETILGSPIKEIQAVEKELHLFARRGVQAVRQIKKGEILREDDNIAILRPGKQSPGVHPKRLMEMTGKKATRDIPLGDGIKEKDWDD
jgi:sialic acid synthase SpsE/RimJ/RimL family protein N-acetyltransferase